MADATHRIWPVNATTVARDLLLVLVNSPVAGLNYLHNCGSCVAVPIFASSVQLGALTRYSLSWWRLAKHMADNSSPLIVNGAFQTLVNKAASSLFAPLRAECVDMPLECGQVDADEFLPNEVRETVHDPATMFHDDVDDVNCDARFRGAARAEYIMLVRRQCRARKVGLMHKCRHAASVLTVRKKGTDRLRGVWDDGELSRHTAPPPLLPFMTTPAALSTLESSDDRPLLHSCRDGEAFFDQLNFVFHTNSGRSQTQRDRRRAL